MSANEVYLKIKEMSTLAMNPRPQIPLQQLIDELREQRGHIMPILAELKKMRLIQVSDTAPAYVRLTMLGHNAAM